MRLNICLSLILVVSSLHAINDVVVRNTTGEKVTIQYKCEGKRSLKYVPKGSESPLNPLTAISCIQYYVGAQGLYNAGLPNEDDIYGDTDVVLRIQGANNHKWKFAKKEKEREKEKARR